MLAPVTSIPGMVVPSTIQVNIGLKSVNSMYMCFHYMDYKTRPDLRKHDKVSHNIKSLQMKIGTDYYPSQPVTVKSGGTVGEHTPFIMELFKAAGKLHATESDIGISPPSYCIDDTHSQLAGYEDVEPAAGNTVGVPIADPTGKRSAVLRECVFSTYLYNAGRAVSTVLNPCKQMYPSNLEISQMTTGELQTRLTTGRHAQGVGLGQGQFTPFLTADNVPNSTTNRAGFNVTQAIPDSQHVYAATAAY